MSPRARADLLVYSALVAGVFIVYRGVFDVYFLNEDFSWLWRCRLVAPTTLWALLTRDVMGGLYSWRPLLQLSFGLNEAIWGVHPFGYRLAGLGWQALATCALYAIGARVADRRRGALAAMLFAVHPVHVESLSWTCARGGPISTALLLLATLGYLAWRHGRKRHGRERQGRGLWMILVPFALAFATLETSVVFVALVLVAEIVSPPAIRWGRRLQLYAALLVVAVGLLWLRHTGSAASMNMNVVGLDPRWPLSAGQLAAHVLQKLQATAALLLTFDGPSGWVAAGIAVAAAAVLLCWWRGRWLGLWGLVWIPVAVAPFTLLLLGPFPRHLHLAMVGFGLLFAELLVTMADAVARWDRRLAVVCVAGLMVLWFAHMIRKIDQATAAAVERGRLSAALLADLHRLVPRPEPGSELAFYRMGDLRARQHVYVYGFEDAVRLLYGDDTLRVQFGAMGSAPQATYQLWYEDGRLALVSGARS